MSAAVRQVPGWWPSLVRVECDRCGYVGPTRDLNARSSMHIAVRAEADQHECEVNR